MTQWFVPGDTIEFSPSEQADRKRGQRRMFEFE
jgi:hypothetical protein